MGRRYSDDVRKSRPIRHQHIMATRRFLDEDIADAPPAYRYQFSWASVSDNDPILARHFIEMREAIQLLWASKGRGGLPSWTAGEAPGGPSVGTTPTVIRASHILDLRVWLNQYEDNHSPSGVNSFCFDPRTNESGPGFGYIVDDDWVGNIDQLSTDFPPPVRCEVRERLFRISRDSMHNDDLARYRTSFSRYASRPDMPNHLIYTLVTKDFFALAGSSNQQNSVDFSPPLSSAVFSNNYINQFSDKCASVARAFSENGLVTNMIQQVA